MHLYINAHGKMPTWSAASRRHPQPVADMAIWLQIWRDLSWCALSWLSTHKYMVAVQGQIVLRTRCPTHPHGRTTPLTLSSWQESVCSPWPGMIYGPIASESYDLVRQINFIEDRAKDATGRNRIKQAVESKEAKMKNQEAREISATTGWAYPRTTPPALSCRYSLFLR